jgi:hypothetical protein
VANTQKAALQLERPSFVKGLRFFWGMSLVRLTVGTCFLTALLRAGDGQQTYDPFAPYHQALDKQMSTILEAKEPPPSENSENAVVQQTAPPDEDKAGEMKTFAKRFWRNREADLTIAVGRLQRLRPDLESILSDEGLPKQLVAVVLIESAAEPLAISPRQARGLWQLIPETARQYGLTVSAEDDERIRLESATRAAAHYLRDLYRRFGDWALALAAYNAGQKAVENALVKGRATTFWQLSSAGLLPLETRTYVPAVLSAMQLLGLKTPADRITPQPQSKNWVYAFVSGY